MQAVVITDEVRSGRDERDDMERGLRDDRGRDYHEDRGRPDARDWLQQQQWQQWQQWQQSLAAMATAGSRLSPYIARFPAALSFPIDPAYRTLHTAARGTHAPLIHRRPSTLSSFCDAAQCFS